MGWLGRHIQPRADPAEAEKGEANPTVFKDFLSWASTRKCSAVVWLRARVAGLAQGLDIQWSTGFPAGITEVEPRL